MYILFISLVYCVKLDRLCDCHYHICVVDMGSTVLKNFLMCLVLVLTVGLASGPIAAAPLKITVTAAHFSPLQMMIDGKATGYVTELVERVIARVNAQFPIDASPVQILPFRRALKGLTGKPNVLFFSLSRTKEREDKYIWVGAVSPYEIFFYKLRGNQAMQSRTLGDAIEHGHVFGVTAASNTEEVLKNLHLKKGENYVTYPHYSNGIAMLFRHRFALLPLTPFVARANVCKLGFDGDAIEPMIRVNELSNSLWLVFSKGTNPLLVKRFKSALQALKTEGIDRVIRQDYLDKLNSKPCTTNE